MIKLLKPKSEFAKNTLTLMTGTAIAQAIPIALTPILTRLYTPEDFGLLALYLAMFSVLQTIATGRYELAILAPVSDKEAQHVVFLSVLIAFCMFVLTFIPILIFNKEITFLIGVPEIGQWLYFVPITVFLFGIYQSIDYWLNRKKNYKQMSKNKLIRAGGISLVQLLMGFFYKSGLLVGVILGWFVSVFAIVRESGLNYKCVNFSEIKKIAFKYKDYPLYQMPTSFLNALSSQAPVLFISKFHDSTTVGFYSLVVKVLSAPAVIISKSIGQVFFQRASEHARISPELLLKDIYLVAKKLLFISMLFFLPIFFYGTEVFQVILGSEWGQAGKYAEVLVIAISIKFIVSPLSIIFLAVDKIKIGSFWQITYFMTTILTLYVSIDFDFNVFLWIYVIHELVLYSFYFFLMVYAVKLSNVKSG